jgi:hypothetical protein
VPAVASLHDADAIVDGAPAAKPLPTRQIAGSIKRLPGYADRGFARDVAASAMIRSHFRPARTLVLVHKLRSALKIAARTRARWATVCPLSFATGMLRREASPEPSNWSGSGGRRRDVHRHGYGDVPGL